MCGQCIPYSVPTDSTVRSYRYFRPFWYSWNRRGSTSHASIVGCPAAIHSATSRPAPGPAAMPVEFNPAHRNMFRSSGASPSMYRLSGVKLSALT